MTTQPTQSKIQTSTGRGGAGNITSEPNERFTADDLKTPTIKSQAYTTGRGGTGNIATNDSPASARRAQDVDTPLEKGEAKGGTYHWGRGGEGNRMTVDSEGREEQREKSVERRRRRRPSEGQGQGQGQGPQERRGSFTNRAVEKGREMFKGGGKKERERGTGESAISDD